MSKQNREDRYVICSEMFLLDLMWDIQMKSKKQRKHGRNVIC